MRAKHDAPRNPGTPAADNKRSQAFRRASPALDNVSVDIRPGERFGLIVRTAREKTTLINCISGAFRTEAGTVVFREEDITRLQRMCARAAHCAQIPDPAAVQKHDGGRKPHGRARFRGGHGPALRLGCATTRHHDVDPDADGSRVEGRRVGTKLSQWNWQDGACPRDGDAPKAPDLRRGQWPALSSSEVDEVLDLLMSLASQDITIIMIEHIMQAVMRFSDRVMCLDAGRIIAIGTPSEVMANQRVQEAYLGT